MLRRPVTLAGTLVLAVATACGSGNDATTSAPQDPSTTSVPTTDAPVPSPPPIDDGPTTTDAPVPELLDVVAPVVGGGELDLASFAGRPLALWFWAPT